MNCAYRCKQPQAWGSLVALWGPRVSLNSAEPLSLPNPLRQGAGPRWPGPVSVRCPARSRQRPGESEDPQYAHGLDGRGVGGAAGSPRICSLARRGSARLPGEARRTGSGPPESITAHARERFQQQPCEPPAGRGEMVAALVVHANRGTHCETWKINNKSRG